MKKTFWDRTAKIYNRFMKKDHRAYKQMYSLIYPVVRHKQVLELATGTGLIAKHIVRSAGHNVRDIAWFVCRKGEAL